MTKSASLPPAPLHSGGQRHLTHVLGVLLLWGAVTIVTAMASPLQLRELVVGEVASRNIYAPHDVVDATATPPRLFKRGQRLVQQGDVVTSEHMALLSLFKTSSVPATSRWRHIAGTGLVVALLLLLGWALLRTFAPAATIQSRPLWLIGLVLTGTLALSRVVLEAPWPLMAIPLSAAAMLITLLLNAPSAMIATVVLTPLIGLLARERTALLIVLMVAALVSILAVRTARHRGQLLRAGIIVGLLHALGLMSLALLRDMPATLTDVAWGFANGIASSFIVMGLLPVFEHLFQLTTDIRLLELADLNHPILKELVLKAPGTYHHSLIVGNLAEAACEAIGANALLARVGSYFHDIGKMEQAEYFIENQAGGDYLHDKLTPAMSGLIITNHVRRGMAVAKKAKLPQAIIDFIPQHHGTGLVFYFYHKALEKYDEAELAETDFRYEGPKPQSRETAVALLADGIEASCRALVDPTPARIRGLVRKIINARFIDGQLDECDLTLRDLTKIEEVFTRVLLGIHHTRIQYPETDDDSADLPREPAARPSDSSAARGGHHRPHS